MKERPILFNGQMVRAILEGRKTQTRRAMRVQPIRKGPLWEVFGAGWSKNMTSVPAMPGHSLAANCPYGQHGDRLLVRESTHRRPMLNLLTSEPLGSEYDGGAYSADDAPVLDPKGFDVAWWYSKQSCPSIHMPRWASRITLEITDVRVERLQTGEGETASESRYLAEGINRIHHGDGDYCYSAFRDEPHPNNWTDPFDAWRELWTSTGGDWNSNPWVWVIEFKRLQPAAGGQ